MITYEVPVYIGKENGDSGILIKCHDSGVRFAVKLMVSGWVSKWKETAKPYIIPEGATAKFRVRRYDRARTSTDAHIESDGAVICPVHPYSVATPGSCDAEVVLFDKNGLRLTSATFVFVVDEECAPVNGEDDPVYVDSIQGLLSSAESAAKRAEDAADAAEKAMGEVDPAIVEKSVNKYLEENPPTGLPDIANNNEGMYLTVKNGVAVWAKMTVPEQYGLVTYTQDKTISIT